MRALMSRRAVAPGFGAAGETTSVDRHRWLRRTVAQLVALLTLAGVLVVVPAVTRSERASAATVPPADAPYQCGGTGTLSQGYLRVQVPAGAQISVTVTGTGTPTPYVGYGMYVEFWAEASFLRADGSEQWETYTQTSEGSYTPVTKTATKNFTNTGSTAQYLWMNLDDSHLIVGNGFTVSASVSFLSGAGAPCLPLTGDEFAVPSRAERNSCGAQPGAADPVNVVQGNFWQSWTDVAVAGRGPGLSWERTYSSSRAASDGPLGYGWAASYFMTLTRSGDVVAVSQENGAVVRFAKVFGAWAPSGRADATLVEESDGTFTFTRLGREVFRFSSVGKLIAAKDLSGNTTTLTYVSGLLSSISDASGRALTLTWTGSRVTKVAAPPAALATGGAAVAIDTTYGYDASGNLTSVTDTAGGIWTFGYDASHRIVTIREPRHQSLGASAPVVENHYDSSGRVDWQEDRLDRRTTFVYATGATTVTDPSGHVVVYEHTNGVCTGMVRNPGPNESRWAYEIDPAALGRTKTTDPNGIVTTVSFDARGRPLTVNEAGLVTQYSYTPEGLPATIKDPTGTTTTYSYDPGTDRLRTVSRPITPGTGTATQTFTYGDPANPGLPTSMVDVRGKTWTYGYDTYGNLTATTDPTGRKATSVYNTVGWPLSSVAPAGNAAGGNPAQQTTRFVYDRDGNVVSTSDPTGATTQFDYDASNNLVARRDPVGVGAPVEQTGYTFDDADELTTVTRPDSTQLTTDYWPDGSIKTQRDGAGNASSYVYDSQGRLATTTDPDGRVTTLGYDPGGRVTTRQQPGGNCAAVPKTGCVSYSYFDSGQPHVVDYSDPSTPDVTYGYDHPGRTTTMADSSGTSTWVYDSLGRLQSFTDPSGTVGYGFTDAGAATSLTYPGGKTVTRTFDDAGRQLTSTGWAGGTATYGYDPNANLTTINTPATTGVEDTFGFDQANRMTGYTLRKATTVTGSITYTRDPEGMVASSTGSGLPGVADTLGYRPTDMLASDTTGTYSYDSADGLTGLPDGTKQRFDPAGQLCYSSTTNANPCTSPPTGATTFSYDTHGNRVAQRPPDNAATILGYDQADRLTSAKVPSAPDGSSQYHDLSSLQNYLQTNVNYTTTPQILQVGGTHSVPAASQVQSVLFRLTAKNAGGFGTVTVVPNGTTAPSGTYSMVVDPGEAASVLAVSKLDANGRVKVTATTGLTLSIEVVGWYSKTASGGGLTFTATSGPTRAYSDSVGANTARTITVAGVGGVPSDASSVAVTLHSIGAAGAGFFTAYSGTQPISPSLAYDASTSASELTVVPVSNGTIKLYSYAATYAEVDIVGWYSKITNDGGNIAHTLDPAILMDTAGHTGTCTVNGTTASCTKLPANQPVTLHVAGNANVPAAGASAVAVVIHTGVPDTSGINALTAYSTDATGITGMTLALDRNVPFASTTAIMPVGHDGKINVLSSTGIDIDIQTIGWFEPATKTYTYTYSGDGLRRTKTAPDGTVTTFTWDRSTGTPELLAEVVDVPAGTANDKTIRYLYGPDGTVTADITTTSAGDTLRWYHHDQLGSTRALTDTSGTIIPSSLLSYTSYGKPIADPATDAPGYTPVRWAGQYRDPETGYTYLRARYYDPATGQFLNRDPIEQITREPYQYAGNNPINNTDPTGMFCVGDLCTDGITDALDDAWDYGYEVATDAVDDAADFTWRNRGTIATIGAAGACVSGVGLAACGYWAAGAFVARSSQRIDEHGFSNSLRTNLVDGGLTYLTFGLSGAFEALAGPWAGVGGVGALERSPLLSFLGGLIPAGYDITNLFGWLDEQC
jgi:RHS repeat-associated protein